MFDVLVPVAVSVVMVPPLFTVTCESTDCAVPIVRRWSRDRCAGDRLVQCQGPDTCTVLPTLDVDRIGARPAVHVHCRTLYAVVHAPVDARSVSYEGDRVMAAPDEICILDDGDAGLAVSCFERQCLNPMPIPRWTLRSAHRHSHCFHWSSSLLHCNCRSWLDWRPQTQGQTDSTSNSTAHNNRCRNHSNSNYRCSSRSYQLPHRAAQKTEGAHVTDHHHNTNEGTGWRRRLWW